MPPAVAKKTKAAAHPVAAVPLSPAKKAPAAAAQRGDGHLAGVLDSARTWMGLLPDSLHTERRVVEDGRLQNYIDPMHRFFEGEMNIGATLLQDVRQDLNNVVQICLVKFKMIYFTQNLC